MCGNLKHEWRGLRFNTEIERQVCEKFFMAILFTVRVFDRKIFSTYVSLLEISVLVFEQFENPAHYLLDYGESNQLEFLTENL